ncbi:UNVERIFIED_CONTAM: hypothetical protein Sangu_0773200 [Sesamum angustifolium]|uniref:Uncharacterized protein n=1 Tax=Sesamum angustifolium TaxID=2727405 RepID=A0AAW2PUY2_9LAMI
MHDCSLTRDVNGFNLCLLHLLLGHRDRQHPILHCRLYLIQLDILWQPEAAEELAAAPLHPVPFVVLLSCSLLLSPLICRILPSSTSTLTSSFFNPGTSTLNMGLRRLFPVDAGVGDGGGFSCGGGEIGDGGGEREALKGIPDIQRNWIEDVAPAVTKEAWNQRHCLLFSKNSELL